MSDDLNKIKEKTDWGKIEQALLKHGLKFNKYGIWFNDRNFELTRMYLSSDYTILTFYNQKGFKSMFNGMEFPLLIVAEYEDAIEDIKKERPDDIRIFDDVDDGYSYASHLDSRAEEYSKYKNSRDFLLTQKELCEGVEMKNIEIKEECMIPGTDIILEAGDHVIYNYSWLKQAGEVSNANGRYSIHIDTKDPKDNADNLDYNDFSQRVQNLWARGYRFRFQNLGTRWPASCEEVLNHLKNNSGSYEVWIIRK